MSAVISVINPARYRAGTARLMTTVGIGTTVPTDTMTVGIDPTMTKPGDFAVLLFSQDLCAGYVPPPGWITASASLGICGTGVLCKTLTQSDIDSSNFTVTFDTESPSAIQLYNFRPYYSEPINTSFSESVGSYLEFKDELSNVASGSATTGISIPLSFYANTPTVRITIQYVHGANVAFAFVNTPSYAGSGTGIVGGRTISGNNAARSFYGIFPDTNNYSLSSFCNISTTGTLNPLLSRSVKATNVIFALNPRFG